MSVAIVTVILVIILVVLGFPFFNRYREALDSDDEKLQLALRLQRQRDRIYEEIRAQRQEFSLGYISSETLEEYVKLARFNAAGLLQEQGHAQRDMSLLETQVEAELQLIESGESKQEHTTHNESEDSKSISC